MMKLHEDRAHKIAATLLESEVPMTRQCGYCRKVFDPATGQFSAGTPPDPKNVTHGICPECKEGMRKQMADIQARGGARSPYA